MKTLEAYKLAVAKVKQLEEAGIEARTYLLLNDQEAKQLYPDWFGINPTKFIKVVFTVLDKDQRKKILQVEKELNKLRIYFNTESNINYHEWTIDHSFFVRKKRK